MSSPSISIPSIASLGASTASLGGNITSAGSAALTTAGVVLSLTSVNAAPALAGSGVTNIVLGTIPTVAAFVVPATGLTPGAQYSFAAYAINAVPGTTYTAFGTFTTLSLPPFLSFATTDQANGVDIWIHLKGRQRPVPLKNVISATALGLAVFQGTYRDLFNGIQGGTSSAGSMAYVVTVPPSTGGTIPSAYTGVSLSDEVAHAALRQGQWIESGVLFTLASGLQSRWLDKEIYGWTNAVASDMPANVFK